MSKISKIGIMTCGGDCPGLNPVVRAVCLYAFNRGWEVLGIEDSMQGLIDLDYSSPYGNRWLTRDLIEDIISKGGSILGCDNHSHPFRYAVKLENGKKEERDVSAKVVENFKKLGLDALVVIGGDGSMDIGNRLYKLGIPVVGVPKTIDNDLGATDYTFGFDTAVQTITQAVDKIKDTARSHDRVIIVEVMGRDAGWLALHSGIAGGAKVVIVPEIPYSISHILETIRRRKDGGHPFCVIVVAEGAIQAGGEATFEGERKAGEMIKYAGAGDKLAKLLEAAEEDIVPGDIRVSVLGYIQRGGSPSNFDRILGSRFGAFAAQLIEEGKFGHMASLKTPDIVAVPLDEATKNQKRVDPNSQIVKQARELGICFGDAVC